MSSSDIRSRLLNYKPQNPCSHCGRKWNSIFMCNEYHNLYYDNYEPLQSFIEKQILIRLIMFLMSMHLLT